MNTLGLDITLRSICWDNDLFWRPCPALLAVDRRYLFARRDFAEEPGRRPPRAKNSAWTRWIMHADISVDEGRRPQYSARLGLPFGRRFCQMISGRGTGRVSLPLWLLFIATKTKFVCNITNNAS